MPKDGIELVREVPMDLPALKMPKQVVLRCGRQVERDILHNIVTQRQASGQPIKRNRELYADTKRRKRWTLQGQVVSLVAQFKRFVKPKQQSWRTHVDMKKVRAIIRPATMELKQLSLWVQKKGYTGWFAISKRGRLAIKGVIRQWLKAEFDKKAKG